MLRAHLVMFGTGNLHNYLTDMGYLCVLLLHWRFPICSRFNHASNPRAANRDCVARNKTEEAIIYVLLARTG